MPGFNGMGPRGLGSMTGGGRGFCKPWGVTPQSYRMFPRMGYGYHHYGEGTIVTGSMPNTPWMTREQELDFLKNQAQEMKGQMGQLESRIEQLVNETKDESK